jgi:signal transduction histidine kinase
VDDAVNEIRILTREQVTPRKEIRMQPLIHSLVEKMKEHPGLVTEFNYQLGSMNIPDDLKLNIYRIIQEVFNNILKHASASKVSLDLFTDGKKLQVSIVDNGKGFDEAVSGKGIGLSNIQNRVQSFNGQLDIKSFPGQGTRIELSFPV